MIDKTEKQLWNYTTEEITQGFSQDKENFICVLCGKRYTKGKIYSISRELFDAYGAVKIHIKDEHGMTADYLLNQELTLTGISEIQRQLLKLVSEGKSDKEIAQSMGIAQSTVRNHKFKLREKEKQAKLYLALMNSLEEKINNNIAMTECGEIEEIHKTATMVDDRYSITEKDREKTVKTYMNENGSLKQFPVKEKKKIIILSEILKNFKSDKEYSEKEINKILKSIYEDFATLRRALIEYGFMERTSDCSAYKIKE